MWWPSTISGDVIERAPLLARKPANKGLTRRRISRCVPVGRGDVKLDAIAPVFRDLLRRERGPVSDRPPRVARSRRRDARGKPHPPSAPVLVPAAASTTATPYP